MLDAGTLKVTKTKRQWGLSTILNTLFSHFDLFNPLNLSYLIGENGHLKAKKHFHYIGRHGEVCAPQVVLGSLFLA